MKDELTDEHKIIELKMYQREQAEKESFGSDKPEGGGGGDIPEDFLKACFYANERGDGDLFEYIQHGKFLYVANADQWFAWKGHYWAEDRKNRSLRAVEDVALAYRTLLKDEQDENIRKSINRRIDKLRSRRGQENCRAMAAQTMVIDGDELDSSPMLLACVNGVVDLEKGRVRQGQPKDYLKNYCPTEWKGIDAPAPHWEKFLREITDNNEELIDFLHRLLGYGITGLTVEHILPIVRGRGRNGKGVLVDVLSSVLGEVAGPIRAEMLLDQGSSRSSAGPTPDIMALRGRRIAFASETDEGARFSASKVKWLTGADELIGRNPHDKHESRFRPSHLLFLFTNRPPFAAPNDYAFFERTAVVMFPFSFVQHREPINDKERRADKYLAEKLRDESSGILAWLVRGCLRWQKEGLIQPECVRKETGRYRQMLDYFQGFLDNCCDFGDDLEISASDFYQAFRTWYNRVIKPEKNEKTPTQKAFSQKANAHFEQVKHDGGRRYYQGVALMSSEHDEAENESILVGQKGFCFDPETA